MAKLLVTTEGVENPILELRLGVNRVGRSLENHFQIDHPTISWWHCEIVLSDAGLVLRDCDSTNGTYINGQRVREATLQTGQTIQLGGVELLVETTEATVAIPRREPLPALPVVLPDGATPCPKHPRARATYECTECHAVMCDACVHHLKRRGGSTFHLCPHCSKPCVSLFPEPPKKRSLFAKFKQTVVLHLTGNKPRKH